MNNTSFNPLEKLIKGIPPTEMDSYFRSNFTGYINDPPGLEGGVSGHAGVFKRYGCG
jgi:hypothetical protein